MTDLERAFETLWRQCGGPKLEREHKFHPNRRWRFDFAHLPTMTAFECDGGTWANGRHTRGAGFAADCEKYNAAALLGWRVFRFTSDMLQNAPYQHLRQIVETISLST